MDADLQRAENGITLRDQIAVVVIAQARHECACRASLSDLLQLIRRVIHIGQHGSARIRLRQPVPQRIVRVTFCGAPPTRTCVKRFRLSLRRIDDTFALDAGWQREDG